MLKKFFLMAAGVMLSSGVMAEDDHTAMQVNLTNGKVVTIWLGDMPTITHEYVKESDSFVVAITGRDATFTFPIEEVQKALFIDTPTSVEELEMKEGESITFTDGRCVHLRGISGRVSVYGTGGEKVNADVKYASESSADIDLSGLKDGVYVVSVANGRTYKVVKR